MSQNMAVLLHSNMIDLYYMLTIGGLKMELDN